MKSSIACRMLAFTVFATSISSMAKSPDQAEPWSVLNSITHKRTYEIETRDRKCVRGKIIGVASDRLTVKVYSNLSGLLDTVVVPRAAVLRVANGKTVYYSGRSSWSDVSSLHLQGREQLQIVTAGSKIFRVRPPYTVSDQGITLSVSGKSATISKGEVARVYHIVEKPLSDGGVYAAQELGPMIIFDPDWYVWGLHLEHYVPVLLYDASESEDNSPVQCVPQ
jgi:hypothetical protein